MKNKLRNFKPLEFGAQFNTPTQNDRTPHGRFFVSKRKPRFPEIHSRKWLGEVLAKPMLASQTLTKTGLPSLFFISLNRWANTWPSKIGLFISNLYY